MSPINHQFDTVGTSSSEPQEQIIRDLRAVKSACPAYTKSYILPTTEKRIVQLRTPVLASYTGGVRVIHQGGTHDTHT